MHAMNLSCFTQQLKSYHQNNMPPSRIYVSGWSSRVDRSGVGLSTVRDTGAGTAASATYAPISDENSYDAIRARCVQNGTLWEDPDFPAAKESLFFKTPPSGWPNIQWKRPRVRIFLMLPSESIIFSRRLERLVMEVLPRE
jgi:hypothetical protein